MPRPDLAVLVRVVTHGVLHQLLVGHGADRVLDVGAAVIQAVTAGIQAVTGATHLDVGAALPAQPRPVAADLHPDLGAVVGLGQTPLKTRGPVTCRERAITSPL